MPDRETWRFINTFAPWLSAMGTTIAVIVSLYLARRSSRSKMRVSISIKTMMGGAGGREPEFLHIKAVNDGFRDVTITGIAWRIRGFKPQAFIVLPPNDPYSTKLPARLAYGDQASFFPPVSDFPKEAESLLSNMRNRSFLGLTLRMTRAGVYSSTGDEFLVPLDKWMRDWLRERVNHTSS